MSDKTAAGAARITKTKRVAYSIQQADITNGTVTVALDFDTPFVDTNFTATVGASAIAPADPSTYFPSGFGKRVDGIDLTLVVESGNVGDQVELHVHAIHD